MHADVGDGEPPRLRVRVMPMRRVLFWLVLPFAGMGVLLGVIAPAVARWTSTPEPHPAAEYRMVMADGRIVGQGPCTGGIFRGRMLLGEDGRWWLHQASCRHQPDGVRTGTWRWSGDTLLVYDRRARPGDPPRARLVMRRDTLDLVQPFEGRMRTYRYVRVPPARR